jgi:hypothetical protein
VARWLDLCAFATLVHRLVTLFSLKKRKETKFLYSMFFFFPFFFSFFFFLQDAKRGTTHTANELATTN